MVRKIKISIPCDIFFSNSIYRLSCRTCNITNFVCILRVQGRGSNESVKADTAASPDSVRPESSGSPHRVTPSAASPSRVMSDTPSTTPSLRIVEDVTCEANNDNCKDVSNRHHTTTMHHHHHQSTASGRDGIPLEDFYRDGIRYQRDGIGF